MIRAEIGFFALQPLNLLHSLHRWSAIYRQRQALARLDEAALRDIGLTRAEAMAEASRPIWDAPDNWRF
jgi:uncharacterized protein YjiS (DUF1127 family)